jgi:hypothetical protein
MAMTLAVSNPRLMNGPLFVAVNQAVVHNLGGIFRILKLGDEIKYNRHGRFTVASVGSDWAVIEHNTLSGRIIPVFLLGKTGMHISDGAFVPLEVHHESYVHCFGSEILAQVKLKICFNCGPGQIDQRYEFCPYCGHKLS